MVIYGWIRTGLKSGLMIFKNCETGLDRTHFFRTRTGLGLKISQSVHLYCFGLDLD